MLNAENKNSEYVKGNGIIRSFNCRVSYCGQLEYGSGFLSNKSTDRHRHWFQ